MRHEAGKTYVRPKDLLTGRMGTVRTLANESSKRCQAFFIQKKRRSVYSNLADCLVHKSGATRSQQKGVPHHLSEIPSDTRRARACRTK